MKNIYHIRLDFHSATWVIPRGGTWGYCGGFGVKFFSFSEIQQDLVCELLTWMAHAPAQFFGSPPPGALVRGQKFNFLNMISWHIKLKGMSSRPGSLKNFNLRSNWWPLDGVKGSITIRFLPERWDLRWHAIKCVLVELIIVNVYFPISFNIGFGCSKEHMFWLRNTLASYILVTLHFNSSLEAWLVQ